MDREATLATHTDRVVLEHAHRGCKPRSPEGVEEAGHGHGEEAHGDDARLGCRMRAGSARRIQSWDGLRDVCLRFFAMVGGGGGSPPASSLRVVDQQTEGVSRGRYLARYVRR